MECQRASRSVPMPRLQRRQPGHQRDEDDDPVPGEQAEHLADVGQQGAGGVHEQGVAPPQVADADEAERDDGEHHDGQDDPRPARCLARSAWRSAWRRPSAPRPVVLMRAGRRVGDGASTGRASRPDEPPVVLMPPVVLVASSARLPPVVPCAAPPPGPAGASSRVGAGLPAVRRWHRAFPRRRLAGLGWRRPCRAHPPGRRPPAAHRRVGPLRGRQLPARPAPAGPPRGRRPRPARADGGQSAALSRGRVDRVRHQKNVRG